jgi:hypothetical protein
MLGNFEAHELPREQRLIRDLSRIYGGPYISEVWGDDPFRRDMSGRGLALRLIGRGLFSILNIVKIPDRLSKYQLLADFQPTTAAAELSWFSLRYAHPRGDSWIIFATRLSQGSCLDRHERFSGCLTEHF